VKQSKAKKGSLESVNGKLQLVMKSGKVAMGYKSVLKTLRKGTCASLEPAPRARPRTLGPRARPSPRGRAPAAATPFVGRRCQPRAPEIRGRAC
jgi:hypothetical protein